MDKTKIINRLSTLCARREYSSSDIYKKALKLSEDNRELADEVLVYLHDNKFVDDERYALAYAREKALISAWGKKKIAYYLSHKGIERDIIDSALSQIDSSKSEKLFLKLLSNKYRSVSKYKDWKQRLLRFSISRGYSYDDFKLAVQYIEDEANALK